MKKLLAVLLSLILAVSIFASCDENDEQTTPNTEANTTAEATEASGNDETTAPGVVDTTTAPEVDETTAVDTEHQHTEETIPAVAATCTKIGLTEGKKCAECGEVLVKQEETPVIAHTEVKINAVVATCTKTGLTEGKKCSVCGTVILAQNDVAVMAHTYDDKYDAICNVCGFVRDAECAHTETEKIAGKAATCTATGLTDGTKCKKCGEILTKQETIKTIPHSEVVDKAVAATCTKTGLTEGKHCSVCNTVTKKQNTVSALGHQWNTGKITTEPTCTEKGVKVLECTNCDGTKIEEVVANGHVYTIDTITPTCIAKGKNTYLCSACSDYYEKEWDALDLNVTLSNNGTAIYNGVYSYLAQLKITITGGCNADAPISGVFMVMLFDGNYNYSYIVSPYMMNYDGEYSYSKTLWIPYGQYFCVFVNFDTTNGEGVQYYNENWSYRYVVKEIAHQYVDNVIFPTKIEQGYTEHTCSICGDYYVDNEVPATGSN